MLLMYKLKEAKLVKEKNKNYIQLIILKSLFVAKNVEQ